MSPEKSLTKAEKDTGLNLFQRMNLIMRDVSYIRKRPTGAGYPAVSHDDVTEKVRVALIEHRVYMHVSTLGFETSTVERKKGAKTFCEVEVCITFINIDDPDDKIASSFVGHGEGADNKTPGAAYSFAVKTAMLKCFAIPTGENEEEVEQEPRAKESDIQAQVKSKKYLKGLCKENGFDYDEVIKYIEGIYRCDYNNLTEDEVRQGCAQAKVNYKPEAKTDG